MKNMIPLCIATLSLFCLTSCSDDDYGDKFHKTLWESSDPSLENVCIEFLCNYRVFVYAEGGTGSYGTYNSFRTSAYFKNATISYDTTSLVIEIDQAHLDGEDLIIYWHYSDSSESHKATMKRLEFRDQVGTEDTI